MTNFTRKPRSLTWLLVGCFASCVVLANWAILHVGIDNGPGHPRTIPLGLGLSAPSGVLFAGALFTLRDLIHERLGAGRTLLVILATAPLSAVTSAPTIALASVATFLIAEAADWAVYARVRRRGRFTAVAASNIVSSLVDSAVFLSLAFGGTPDWRVVAGMTVGKFAASVLTVTPVVVATQVDRRIFWRQNQPESAQPAGGARVRASKLRAESRSLPSPEATGQPNRTAARERFVRRAASPDGPVDGSLGQ
jgi:queuosine precursor transporter